MDRDRNLLFGVLALQADLIDTAQFAEACSAWAARKELPLDSILVERGWITGADKADIERLLERKLKLHAGNLQETLAAEAGPAARSVIAGASDPEISAVFRLDPTPPSTVSTATDHVLLEHLTKPSGARPRYTLTRLHAAGGLGQVWVARDGDLNREVALKELKADQARHPEAWRRFLKEAQVTGQLEHPNIVPVYELARRADDQPFYTMKFVRGQTLRDAIRQYHGMLLVESRSDDIAGVGTPVQASTGRSKTDAPGPHARASPSAEPEADRLELRRLLGAFVGVCNAIAYAHSRGVIHRDLKPSNVVLGGFGEVIVLDWGLAKVVTPEDEAANTLGFSDEAHAETTGAGRVLGTPAYMSPEQAQGQLELLDSRTDIYGLGAILFELLTGRPPHRGKDTKELLDRIINDDTPRVRSADPVAPAALDAICVKAMAKSRDDRYATASELADEVERWLGDEPVRAYPEPLRVRAGRWARRHKAVMTGAAAVLLTAVVGLSISTALIEQQKERVEEQRQIAIAYSTRYRGAMDRMFARDQVLLELIGLRTDPDLKLRPGSGVAPGVSSSYVILQAGDVPELEPTRRALLEEALAFYQELLRDEGSDPLVQQESARAHRRVGEILRTLGRTGEAEISFQRAIEKFERLATDFPDEADHRAQLALSQNGRAVLLRAAGDYSQAEAVLRQALLVMEDLIRLFPQNPEYRWTSADIKSNMGVLLAYLSQPERAAELLRQARDDVQRLDREFPSVPEYRLELARIHGNLGTVLALSGQYPDAGVQYRSALRILRDLQQSPGAHHYLSAHANTLVSLGAVLHKTKEYQEAEAVYNQALQQFESLANDYSKVPEYRQKQAAAHFNIGLLMAQTARLAAAETAFRNALPIQEQLVTDYPSVPDYGGELAATLKELGLVLATTRRLAEAEKAWNRALQLLESLPASLLGRADFRRRLASLYYSQGILMQMTGRVREADTAYAQSIELNQKLADEFPAEPGYQNEMARACANRANVLWMMNLDDQARVQFHVAIDTFEKLHRDFPANAEYEGELGIAHYTLASFQFKHRELEEARQHLGQAIAHVQTALQSHPQNMNFQQALWDSYVGLIETLLGQADHAEALRIIETWWRAFPRQHESYTAARYVARCAALAQNDTTLTDSQRQATVQSYGDRTVELLRSAMEKGFKDADRITRDSDFDAIRARADFVELVNEMRGK